MRLSDHVLRSSFRVLISSMVLPDAGSSVQEGATVAAESARFEVASIEPSTESKYRLWYSGSHVQIPGLRAHELIAAAYRLKERFVEIPGYVVDAPPTDRTGVTGVFDIRLRWARILLRPTGPFCGSRGPNA